MPRCDPPFHVYPGFFPGSPKVHIMGESGCWDLDNMSWWFPPRGARGAPRESARVLGLR